MAIAITAEHRALAESTADFLASKKATQAARARLEAGSGQPSQPEFWDDPAALGLLGLHLPEEYGGSGYGLEELAVVAEQTGRTLAPGPFAPTVIASAVLAAAGVEETKKDLLPGLADGTLPGGIALDAEMTAAGSRVSGTAAAVIGGDLAQVMLIPAGDDVAVIRPGSGVTVEVPPNLDPGRPAARVTLDGAPAVILPGARRILTDLARTVLSAEAAGVARQCAETASAYAIQREQFGRPIATFQAVKHHCANMAVAAELATSAAWDAARAAQSGGEQLTYAAAVAATLAGPAADLCANLSTQVHGGIAITWEHDAHLYMRRATALLGLLDANAAAAELTELTRRGVVRTKSVDLPPEAEAVRDRARSFAAEVAALPENQRLERLIADGYAMPHWPAPYGRDAGAVEQLVIEQEFAAASIERPVYSITGWVILTLIQHGTPEQVADWVTPALRQEVIWCQLFSEPGAGSDAAGVKTRAVKVPGGWKVNGQKIWTSGAHLSSYGFATVRTNPDAPKHKGITMMVIDMNAEGVDVRRIKMPTGDSGFNEVFLTDVFVPDSCVIGEIDQGWKVARATLGNESVSIGGGQGGGDTTTGADLVARYDAVPARLPAGPVVIGRYTARLQAMDLLNMRSAHRAVAEAGPGPEGAITKLVLSELSHEAAAIMTALSGPEGAYLDGPGAVSGRLALIHRGLSIAGGTSEIKRNQIGERILGLPRDPLIK